MKILIVSSLPFSYSCGVRTHLQHLCQALTTLHIDHDLINTNESKALNRLRSFRTGVDFNSIGLFNVWAQSQKIQLLRHSIRKKLSDGRFDIIHAHDVYAAYAAWLEVQKRIPVLFTMHGPLAYEMLAVGEKKNSLRMQKLKKYERVAYSNATACIAVDSEQKRILVDDYHVLESKVQVVYNAVDIDSILSLVREPYTGQMPDRFFLIPRRLVPKNGVEYAIRASALTQNKFDLLIAGAGPQRTYLEELAERNGPGRNVRFLGDQSPDHLLPLMKKALGVIVPSVAVSGVIEATSLAVLEAMALRRPLIASKIGGIWEILRSEENAFLTVPGDAAAIANAMDAVLALDKAELERRTQRNFEILMQHHSLPVWRQKMLDIYTRLYHH